jgi:hypothetical protein
MYRSSVARFSACRAPSALKVGSAASTRANVVHVATYTHEVARVPKALIEHFWRVWSHSMML